VSASGPPEDDAILRPKMGRRNRGDQERVPSFPLRLARTAPRFDGKRARVRKARNSPSRIAVREPHSLSRRCVIKSRYVPMTADGRKLAARHLAYLERDGVERDGSPGRLYGADEKFSPPSATSRSRRRPRATRSARRWRVRSRNGRWRCSPEGGWRREVATSSTPRSEPPIVPQSFPEPPFQSELKKTEVMSWS
jgi:hypothetical protein